MRIRPAGARALALLPLSVAAAMGALAGLGGALGLGLVDAMHVQLPSCYAMMVIGAFAGVGCLAMWQSEFANRESLMGMRLLASMLGCGMVSVGLGGWLRMVGAQSLGVGILVSFGGVLGLWVALRHLHRPALNIPATQEPA